MNKKCLSVPFSLGLVFVLLSVGLLGLFVKPVFAQGYGTENVFNGGCELGYTGWETTVGNNEQSLVEFHGGARSFLDSDDDGFFGHDFYQELAVPVLSENVGHLSFWIKTVDAVYVSVWLGYAVEGVVSEYVGDPVTYADWTLINSTLTSQYPTDSVEYIYISVSCLSAGNKVYLDDISLTSDYYEGASPPDVTVEDAFIGVLVQYIAAVVLILLPAGVMFLLLKISQPFLIMFGLVVGVAISSYLMPTVVPTWSVFAMIIALAGMFVFGRKG